MQPVKSRIIVEPQQAEAKTDYGLILPPSAQVKPSQAVIIAAGKGTKKNPMTAKPGDVVMYRPGAGYMFEFEGKKYLALKEDSILATL